MLQGSALRQPLQGDLVVARIQLDAQPAAAQGLSGQQGGTGAREGIEYQVARLGEGRDQRLDVVSHQVRQRSSSTSRC